MAQADTVVSLSGTDISIELFPHISNKSTTNCRIRRHHDWRESFAPSCYQQQRYFRPDTSNFQLSGRTKQPTLRTNIFPPVSCADSCRRIDETKDTRFYGQPRFVNHIDDNAILNLRRYYGAAIGRNSRVLDLASSWVSHLPDDLALDSLIGIGLNQAELDANNRLTESFVQDLNETPDISLAPASFDHVICNVSIDYLTDPLAVCRSLARLLKPGGTVHFAVSNRCFPTKVVRKWLAIDESARLDMVGAYLHFASSDHNDHDVAGTGSEMAPGSATSDTVASTGGALFRDIRVVEVVKPSWGGDPLHVVTGTRV